jgi:autotransporter-associated beta strand protein
VGGNNLSTTVSGTISDDGLSGSLVKVGTGTLTLSGNNSYGGGTIINAGTLDNMGTLSSLVDQQRELRQ